MATDRLTMGGQPPRPPGVLKGIGQTLLWNGRAKRGEGIMSLLHPVAFRRMHWHRLFLERMRSRRAVLRFTGCSYIPRNRSTTQDIKSL